MVGNFISKMEEIRAFVRRQLAIGEALDMISREYEQVTGILGTAVARDDEIIMEFEDFEDILSPNEIFALSSEAFYLLSGVKFFG